MEKKSYQIQINEQYCKGCGICVSFCPVKALKMNYLKAAPADESLCVGCRSCEDRCPDFAIDIKEKAP